LTSYKLWGTTPCIVPDRVFLEAKELTTMAGKTEKNLAYAFAAESKAAARNAAFAQRAAQEGYTQIARLFQAVSEAESVHARRYLNLMRGKIGSTEENLETAFQNEIRANVDEYPALIKDASEEGFSLGRKGLLPVP
jgi:rubrerythrin